MTLCRRHCRGPRTVLPRRLSMVRIVSCRAGGRSTGGSDPVDPVDDDDDDAIGSRNEWQPH